MDNFIIELRFSSNTEMTDQEIERSILRALRPVEKEFANDLDCELMNRWKKKDTGFGHSRINKLSDTASKTDPMSE